MERDASDSLALCKDSRFALSGRAGSAKNCHLAPHSVRVPSATEKNNNGENKTIPNPGTQEEGRRGQLAMCPGFDLKPLTGFRFQNTP